ncbi:MAG: TonB-dependent receptor [Bacteroidales bacterium]|nr:TonB-dependent receptor [Bacteroidales bacterium]
MRKILVLLALSLLVSVCFADEKKEDHKTGIYGHVVSNGEHVPFANVIIKETNKGTATDISGHYLITDIGPGEYTVVSHALGFKKQEIAITVVEGKKLEVNIQLIEDLIMTEGIVVSANRSEVSRKEAASIVNVLDRKTFDATHAVNLAEGLNFQPGLRVENNCQNCGFTQLRMNGLEGPYTQILIDSRPIFSALSGVYGLEQIPASMIDRIEVVRGGGSVLFGANAIAGTVNVITKEPTENSYQLGGYVSSIDGKSFDKSLNFNSTLVSDDFKSGIFIFGITRNRDPWNANPDELWDEDGDGIAEKKDDFSEMSLMRSSSFGFRAYHRLSERAKLSAEFHYLNEFRRGGNKFELLPHHTDIDEQVDSRVKGGGINYEIFGKNNEDKYSVFVSSQHVDRDSYYGAAQDPNAYGHTEEISFVGGAQGTWHIHKHPLIPHMIVAGAEQQYSDLQDEKMGVTMNLDIADQEIFNTGAFTQLEWEWNKHKLLLGVRGDKHSLVDHLIFSPRASVMYNLTNDMQARLSYSSGFRAPQIFNEDLHIGVAGASEIRTVLDANLKEETSNSVTASWDYTFNIGETQAYILTEGFYTRLNNPFVLQISQEADAESGDVTAVFYRENGSGAQVNGLNLEAKWALNKQLQFQMGFTSQVSNYDQEEVVWEPKSGNADSLVTTLNFLRSPNNYGYFVVQYNPIEALSCNLSGTYTGRMLVPHIVESHNQYTLIENSEQFVDLGCKFSYDIKLKNKIKLQISAGVQNILNSYQAQFDAGINRDAGYVYGPGKPRSYFAGLKIMR